MNKIMTDEGQQALVKVKKMKEFYMSLAAYICVITLLTLINLTTYPGFLWVVFPAIGWGIAITFQALTTFEWISIFGAEWEKKQVEKILEKSS